MSLKTVMRQGHRWLSMLFTLTVIANFVALFLGQTVSWLTYLPLLPLALMLASGLYLFFQPYMRRERGDRRAAG